MIKSFMTVFEYFRFTCKQLSEKFHNYARISDFDNIATEVV